jgi:anti-anti-sigma factor
VANVRLLEIRDLIQGDRARLELIGELDLATAPRLAQAVEDLLAREVQEVTIDLRQLAFLDSSGLRELIALRDKAVTEGWRLALVRPPQPALSVFQITRAEENLPFIEDGDPQ